VSGRASDLFDADVIAVGAGGDGACGRGPASDLGPEARRNVVSGAIEAVTRDAHPPVGGGWAGPAVSALVVVLMMVGCGVEVPDDVAARATSTTTTSEAGPSTTATPTSDDPLEQALIDNGYSADEATCGATNLREELDEDQVDDIIGAEDIDDIGADTAADFARALRDCVDNDASEDDGSEDDGG